MMTFVAANSQNLAAGALLLAVKAARNTLEGARRWPALPR